jgi:tetratricopeptide (TPR) repeat protein
MHKLILFLCITCVAPVLLRAQRTEPPRILQLKTTLPVVQGEEKANHLARIARYYIDNGLIMSDSALHYARLAFDYAKEKNYRFQLCSGANQYAKALLQTTNADEGLKYYRLCTKLAHELANDSMLALGYRGIGEALYYKSDFNQAIDTIRRSMFYFKRTGNFREISNANMVISNINGDQGNYEQAFEGAREALRVGDSVNDRNNVVLSLAQLGYLYKSVGDYETAMEYYRRGFTYKPPEGVWGYRYLSSRMGDLYIALGQFDSAYFYIRQSFSGNSDSKTSKLKMGEYFLAIKNYDSALFYFKDLYDDKNMRGESNIPITAGLGLAKVYLDQKKYKLAEKYGLISLKQAWKKGIKQAVHDGCHLMYRLHQELGQPGHAFYYYTGYVNMKDSIITDQFKGKLYEFRRKAEDERKMAQIELLQKEKLISEQALRETQILRNILMGGILFLCVLGGIIFWTVSLKRKNEKLENDRIQTELQRRASDLEMQALRAQMNPHFIFNCLSSINRFILKNETDKASDYLTRFSRLMRLVLINSQKPLIVLEDEVEMLRLYIEMEQLRFKHAFDYSVTYTNDIEPANILIPPLLLQPFCENAIWHGLMHKDGHGHLAIAFTMHDSVLRCTISDDGIGRAKASEIRSRSSEKLKSFGLKLTADRLALFNEDRSVQTSYKIDDIKDKTGNVVGTIVTLEIRFKEISEVPA